jgi:hypothetical protein
MIVWAGKPGAQTVTNTGGTYDPADNQWIATSLVDAPAARSQHTAVWTGSQMIVWGGYYDASGGRYVPGSSSDDDGDTYDECEGDCDDGRATVHPGAAELCDGVDNDCNVSTAPEIDLDGDGACSSDCADQDPDLHAVPSEVSGLLLGPDKSQLSWESAAPGAGAATVHDVVRGVLPELPASGAETCVAAGLAQAATTDQETPDPDHGFWYLVRGRNGCGDGTYGETAGGAWSVCP